MENFSPLTSAVAPVREDLLMNSRIASMATDMGVRIMEEKSLSSARPVAGGVLLAGDFLFFDRDMRERLNRYVICVRDWK